jgi:hypothetical protein
LQVDGLLFDYDLPTSEQYEEADIKEDGKLYVVRRLIDPKYNKLMNYLAGASWKEADQETYRLMITTVGKEEGQYFEPKDLLNFPCEDLKTIDSLWVKYSNGHFGFSVQKKIYVECGAKLDGNYPGDKVWEKFGDRVGWRAGGWLDYNDLNPSLTCPQGNFPVAFWRWRGLGDFNGKFGGLGFIEIDLDEDGYMIFHLLD